MKTMKIFAVSAAVLVASPAIASDNDFYVGGEIGVVLAANSDQTYTPGTTAGTTGQLDTDHTVGYDVAAFAGYDFGAFRVEAEASYRSAGYDNVTATGLVFPGNVTGAQAADGDVRSLAFMGNAMIDIGQDSGLNFFVGGGAGMAEVEVSALRASAGTGSALDDQDWVFAWQGFAGARYPVSDSVDVQLRYRYFRTNSADLVGFGGRAVDMRLETHTVSAGLIVNF